MPLIQALASPSRSSKWKRRVLSQSLRSTLDRVNVLGTESDGHTGCVNALSWAQDGELLISGGDDTTVRIWRMDQSDTTTEYPFVCKSVIRTGHRQNIFNVHMLPRSSRIASVSGDKQVRVFDVKRPGVGAVDARGCESGYSARDSCLRIFKCHASRVKRIVTEDSADSFLTVSEDGTVRQHDLRTPHNCTGGACPPPLVKMPIELSTLALSSLTPYHFVVAGESPYGYLFDRRQVGRVLQEEWGMLPNIEDFTTCVRRFGRRTRGPGERRGYEHITGARVSDTNGHEVLLCDLNSLRSQDSTEPYLAYSSDAVYLYSTRDEPDSERHPTRVPILSRNAKRRKLDSTDSLAERQSPDAHDVDVEMMNGEVHQTDPAISWESTGSCQEEGVDELCEEDVDLEENTDVDIYPSIPVILPRARFAGVCNVETVKDVNFLGPNDEYVVSGSDDGNFFMWRKSTGTLHGILEGDSSVVNVIEGHPFLPLVAVSGIDTTIKLFAPVRGPSLFSRLDDAEAISERNAESARRALTPRIDIARLIMDYGLALRGVSMTTDGNDGDFEQCRNQ